MKLLLDENLPKKLKRELPGFTVFTTSEMGWNGKENGELLSLMIQNGFTALLTADKNLQHQQNFKRYTIPVIVLNSKFITYQDLVPLIPSVLNLLNSEIPPGPIIVSE